jgi:hypothetical protein
MAAASPPTRRGHAAVSHFGRYPLTKLQTQSARYCRSFSSRARQPDLDRIGSPSTGNPISSRGLPERTPELGHPGHRADLTGGPTWQARRNAATWVGLASRCGGNPPGQSGRAVSSVRPAGPPSPLPERSPGRRGPDCSWSRFGVCRSFLRADALHKSRSGEGSSRSLLPNGALP